MRPILLFAVLFLSACGMTRTVGVLPQTLDNLERDTAAAREGREAR
ncbi:hypothetical protein [Aureimonas populi]|uniref:Entericidin A/B family lipoprotein n=1 Tax=Aureimonas populi TaxID=1701758 RepID=A0ABW5CQU1_9HYPH|nr:hypothetical protein [Aureimonas populi]